MPTPTEAAQFHIFSIKRMKYMPRLYEKILKVNSTLSENAQMVKKLLEK